MKFQLQYHRCRTAGCNSEPSTLQHHAFQILSSFTLLRCVNREDATVGWRERCPGMRNVLLYLRSFNRALEGPKGWRELPPLTHPSSLGYTVHRLLFHNCGYFEEKVPLDRRYSIPRWLSYFHPPLSLSRPVSHPLFSKSPIEFAQSEMRGLFLSLFLLPPWIESRSYSSKHCWTKASLFARDGATIAGDIWPLISVIANPFVSDDPLRYVDSIESIRRSIRRIENCDGKYLRKISLSNSPFLQRNKESIYIIFSSYIPLIKLINYLIYFILVYIFTFFILLIFLDKFFLRQRYRKKCSPFLKLSSKFREIPLNIYDCIFSRFNERFSYLIEGYRASICKWIIVARR